MQCCLPRISNNHKEEEQPIQKEIINQQDEKYEIEEEEEEQQQQLDEPQQIEMTVEELEMQPQQQLDVPPIQQEQTERLTEELIMPPVQQQQQQQQTVQQSKSSKSKMKLNMYSKKKKTNMYSKKKKNYTSKNRVGNIGVELGVPSELRKIEIKNQALDFAKTRFAKAWKLNAEDLLKQAELISKQVNKDEDNGFIWTLFAKVSQINPGNLIDSDHENKVIIDLNKQKGTELKEIKNKIIATSNLHDTYIKNDAIDLESKAVEKIIFHLHPTFVPSKMTKTKAPYEVQKVGWGTFWCRIEILIGGEVIEIMHYLDLQNNKSYGLVEIIFNDKNDRVFVEIGNDHKYMNEVNLQEKMENEEEGAVKISSAVMNLAQQRGKRKALLMRQKMKFSRLQDSEKQIHEFINQCDSKPLALGSIMAILLEGSDLTMERLTYFYKECLSRVRYVVLDTPEASAALKKIFCQGLRGENAAASHNVADLEQDAYSLSKKLEDLHSTGDMFFVSHNWNDDAEKRWNFIQEFSDEHFKMYKTYPKLWIDKFCIEQSSESIEINVKLLPLFLKACSGGFLVLLSEEYCTRLWCNSEVYSFYVLSEHSSKVDNIYIKYIDESMRGNNRMNINLLKSECSQKEDQRALLNSLNEVPGGLGKAEQSINLCLLDAIKSKR